MLTITPPMKPRPTTPGEHANHYTTDETTTYHTPGEHANHYTTDAFIIVVLINKKSTIAK
jgi:hypothetical protein